MLFGEDGFSESDKVLCLALAVGIIASLVREFAKKNDWWVFALILHGFLYFYMTTQCDGKRDLYYQLPDSFHHSVCCVDCKIEGWSATERPILVCLACAGIMLQVLPEYWKGQEAVRHMIHVKKGIVNPLTFHIITGIFIETFAGMLALSSPRIQRNKLINALLFVVDIGHQASIHRLLANHDGIWSLRGANMVMSVAKWIVHFRVKDHQLKMDLIFWDTFGFMGARLIVALVVVLMSLGLPSKLIKENWHSIGVTLALTTGYSRDWENFKPIVWICFIASSALYFHQLWRPYLQYRNLFVFANCLLMTIVENMNNTQSWLFTIVYMLAFFAFPHFEREPYLSKEGKTSTSTSSGLDSEMEERVTLSRESIRVSKLLLHNEKSSKKE